MVDLKYSQLNDEQIIRDFANQVLANEGYEVETLGNADDALKMIEGERYNLILVDIEMSWIPFQARLLI